LVLSPTAPFAANKQETALVLMRNIKNLFAYVSTIDGQYSDLNPWKKTVTVPAGKHTAGILVQFTIEPARMLEQPLKFREIIPLPLSL
jgi:hypothetical protein